MVILAKFPLDNGHYISVDDIVMDNGSFYRRQSHYTGDEGTAGTPISEADFWQLQEQFSANIYQFGVTPIR